MIDYSIVGHTAFGLLFCWLLYYFGIREYQIDAFRQRLFVLRDELFDYAASGTISFNDEAYGRLRNTLNCVIRFAHRITGTHLLLSQLVKTACIRNAREENEIARPHRQLIKAIQAIPDEEARKKITGFYLRLVVEICRYLFLTSPIGSVYIIATSIQAFLRSPAQGVPESVTAISGNFEDEAVLTEGNHEPEPELVA